VEINNNSKGEIRLGSKAIAVFASGTGTNTENIIQHFLHHPIIKVKLVVCNKAGVGVLEVAKRHKIPSLLIEREKFFSEGYVAEIMAAKINFIVLAGFLWKVPQVLIDAFRDKIINIHPALLPKFGGKGMYGSKVHEAVIATGEKESGITIHYVDEHYDNGDKIFQAKCTVLPDDTPDSLAKKIHALEYEHFPKVIEDYVLKQ
jgi:phosphoribosylglycinamide formyltransferase-1